jgi:hypothetical protein
MNDLVPVEPETWTYHPDQYEQKGMEIWRVTTYRWEVTGLEIKNRIVAVSHGGENRAKEIGVYLEMTGRMIDQAHWPLYCRATRAVRIFDLTSPERVQPQAG